MLRLTTRHIRHLQGHRLTRHFCTNPPAKPKVVLEATLDEKVLQWFGFGKPVQDPEEKSPNTTPHIPTMTLPDQVPATATGPLVAQESEPQQTLQPIVPVTTTSQTPQTATEITPILPSTQEPTTIQNNIPPNDPDGLLAIHNPPKKKFPPEYNHWPIELVAFYAFLGFTVLYSYFVMSDTKLEEAAELLEYGGAIDQQLAMTKLDTYLRLEMIGIKVSYKMLRFGIVEKLLMTYQTARTPQIRKEAARLLCKISKHDVIRDHLIKIGALEILRTHADIRNIDTIYLIANLSEDLSLDGGMQKILEDENLFDNLMFTMAFSIQRGEYEDKFMQRTIMRLFQNAFKLRYWWDPFTWLYQNNIFLFCKQDSRKSLPNQFQESSGKTPEQYIEQSAQTSSLVLGATVTGIFTFFLAKIDQQFYRYKEFMPLTLPQKHFARMQCWKAPLVAVPLFLVGQGLTRFVELASDSLQEEGKAKSVFPSFIVAHLPAYIQWETPETKAKHYLALIHLLKLPIYYFAIQISPFALVPSLIPWRVNPKSPPHLHIEAAQILKYFYEFFMTPPTMPDPTPQQIEAIFEKHAY